MRVEKLFNAAQNPAAANVPALTAPKAQDYYDDWKREAGNENVSEAQAHELLETLLNIMKAYVDMGHGLGPVNRLIESFEKSSMPPLNMIKYKDAKDE